MTYQEYQNLEKEMEEVFGKVTIIQTGDSRIGNHSYASWTNYYEVKYDGKTARFDDGSIDNFTYEQNRNAALKEVGALRADFPTHDFLDARNNINEIISLPFDAKIIQDYLDKQDSLEDIKTDSVPQMVKDIVDTCHIDYTYSTDELLSLEFGNHYEDYWPSNTMSVEDLPFPEGMNPDDYREAKVEFDRNYDNALTLFPDKDTSKKREYSHLGKITITPEGKEPVSFYYQYHQVPSISGNNFKTIRMVNENDYLSIKNKEYDKLPNQQIAKAFKNADKKTTILKRADQERQDLSVSLYEKYKEKYADNPSLVNAISPDAIYKCLAEMAKARISYKRMDDFMKDMNKMPDRLKKNAPSLRLLYEYESNKSSDKATRRFSPHCPNVQSHYGDNPFNPIIKAYVAAEHERLTGRDVVETIDDLKNRSFEFLEMPSWYIHEYVGGDGEPKQQLLISGISEQEIGKVCEYIDEHKEDANKIIDECQRRIDRLNDELESKLDTETLEKSKDDVDKLMDSFNEIVSHADLAIQKAVQEISEKVPDDILDKMSDKSFKSIDGTTIRTYKHKTIDELIAIAKKMAENDKKDGQDNDMKSDRKSDTDGPGGL